MNRQTNLKLAALARAQSGVASAKQLATAGVTVDALRWLVESRQWRRVGRGVYVIASTPTSWEQRVWIACLETGGVASHRTAGWLHRLDGIGKYAPHELDVLVAFENKRRTKSAKVRRSRTLVPTHLGKRAGPPCTNLARTVIDLSEVLAPKEFALAFDSALRQVDDLRPWVQRLLKPMKTFGHRGIGMLRELLDDDRPPLDSALEVAVLGMLRDGRVPLPRTGVDVYAQACFITKLDFAWPDNQPPVALMAHGAWWHRRNDRWQKDMAQASELSGLGWRVIQCTMRDVEKTPEIVLRNVRRALSGQNARIETVGVHEVIDHRLR